MQQQKDFEPGMPVSVEIAGKQYPLRFTLGVLKALQRDHNISIIRGGLDAFTDVEKLSLVLWYGLRGFDADITQEWVDDNVDAGQLVAMVPALGFAMSGRQASSPNLQAPAMVNGTGSPSGPSGATTSDSAKPTSGS